MSTNYGRQKRAKPAHICQSSRAPLSRFNTERERKKNHLWNLSSCEWCNAFSKSCKILKSPQPRLKRRNHYSNTKDITDKRERSPCVNAVFMFLFFHSFPSHSHFHRHWDMKPLRLSGADVIILGSTCTSSSRNLYSCVLSVMGHKTQQSWSVTKLIWF